jgi:hypothetical protein
MENWEKLFPGDWQNLEVNGKFFKIPRLEE